MISCKQIPDLFIDWLIVNFDQIAFEFKGGYLMEINPRLSTFIYDDDWIEPYFAVKLALGEFDAEDIVKLQQKVPGNRRMLRYFDQHFYPSEELAKK